MPEAMEVPAPTGAVVETTFAPGTVTLEEIPGLVVLKQFVLPEMADGVFMHAFAARLEPDFAVALGERLIAAGRKARSGLHMPSVAETAQVNGRAA